MDRRSFIGLLAWAAAPFGVLTTLVVRDWEHERWRDDVWEIDIRSADPRRAMHTRVLLDGEPVRTALAATSGSNGAVLVHVLDPSKPTRNGSFQCLVHRGACNCPAHLDGNRWNPKNREDLGTPTPFHNPHNGRQVFLLDGHPRQDFCLPLEILRGRVELVQV